VRFAVDAQPSDLERNESGEPQFSRSQLFDTPLAPSNQSVPIDGLPDLKVGELTVERDDASRVALVEQVVPAMLGGGGKFPIPRVIPLVRFGKPFTHRIALP
jgi:hypothetical protein